MKLSVAILFPVACAAELAALADVVTLGTRPHWLIDQMKEGSSFSWGCVIAVHSIITKANDMWCCSSPKKLLPLCRPFVRISIYHLTTNPPVHFSFDNGEAAASCLFPPSPSPS